jgi:hypothetical protein
MLPKLPGRPSSSTSGASSGPNTPPPRLPRCCRCAPSPLSAPCNATRGRERGHRFRSGQQSQFQLVRPSGSLTRLEQAELVALRVG